MASPKFVFLDLDGTLVEFCIDYLGARREALRFLGRYSLLRDSKFTMNDSIFAMDRDVQRMLGCSNKSNESYEEIHKRLTAILEKYEMRAAERTRLLPFATDALQELQKMGLRLVLFTADGEKAVNKIINRTGISGFFEALISRGASMEVKPHPNHITSAMLLVNSKPDETVVVGDSVADIVSGKCVKATTVGVTTGLGSKQELVEAGGDYVIDSVAELPALIRKLCARKPARA